MGHILPRLKNKNVHPEPNTTQRAALRNIEHLGGVPQTKDDPVDQTSTAAITSSAENDRYKTLVNSTHEPILRAPSHKGKFRNCLKVNRSSQTDLTMCLYRDANSNVIMQPNHAKTSLNVNVPEVTTSVTEKLQTVVPPNYSCSLPCEPIAASTDLSNVVPSYYLKALNLNRASEVQQTSVSSVGSSALLYAQIFSSDYSIQQEQASESCAGKMPLHPGKESLYYNSFSDNKCNRYSIIPEGKAAKHRSEYYINKYGARFYKYFRDTDIIPRRTKYARLRKFSHTCKLCRKVLSSVKALRTHMLLHSKEKRYICEVCKKRFRQPSSLCRHRKVHAKCQKSNRKPTSEKIMCNICLKTFFSTLSLDVHKKNHASELQFRCEICKKNFCFRSSLVRHNKMHTSGTYKSKQTTLSSNAGSSRSKSNCTKTIRCKSCGEKFSKSSALKFHVCKKVCKKLSGTKSSSSNKFIRIHSEKNQAIKQCSIRLSRTDIPPNLQHNNSVNFKCVKCNMTFRKRNELNLHNCSTHTTRDKRLVTHKTLNNIKTSFLNCKICSRQLTGITTLKVQRCRNCTGNVKAVTGKYLPNVAGVRCKVPAKTVPNIIKFKSHPDGLSNSKHAQTTRQNVLCVKSKCTLNVPYSQKHNTREGVPRSLSEIKKQNVVTLFKRRIHTDNSKLELNVQKGSPLKEHQCGVCGRLYQHFSSLQRHSKNHISKKRFSTTAHKQKPKCFQCKMCTKTFTESQKLLQHVKTHHLKNFICDTCGNAYALLSSLQRHKKIHQRLKTVLRKFTTSNKNTSLKERANFNPKLLNKNLQKHELPSKRSSSNIKVKNTNKSGLSSPKVTGPKPVHLKTDPILENIKENSFTSKSLKQHSTPNMVKLTRQLKFQETPNFDCELCSKHFKDSSSYYNHMQSHSLEKENSFRCPVCNRKYHQRSSIKRHVKTQHKSYQLDKLEL